MNNKIMIMGISGSGKSTLAKEISNELKIPVVHLDKFLMNVNWNPKNKEEQIKIHNKLLENEKWIIEGNWSNTIQKRANEADLIIFLECPLIVSIYRVTKRLLKHKDKIRSDVANECYEKFSVKFYVYIIKFYFSKRKKHIKWLKSINDTRIYFIKTCT